MIATAPIRVDEAAEHAYIVLALTTVGVSESQARDVADVLVAADVRGIESHGIARLRWFYVDRIRLGTIAAAPVYTTVRETPTSTLIDAGNGLGHPVSILTMRKTIEKAKERGIGIAIGSDAHSPRDQGGAKARRLFVHLCGRDPPFDQPSPRGPGV